MRRHAAVALAVPLKCSLLPERRYALSMWMYVQNPRLGLGPPQSLNASISTTSLTASVVSTIGPVSSTQTLSSMRTPMPRK